MTKETTNEEFISQKQIADMLHYSVQTVIKKRKFGLINSRQFCPRGRVFIDRKKFFEEDMPRLISLANKDKL
ncbi:hypothetical protein [Rhizosphaericola mali]|uniref:Helix-turn-helix domain-containing protein n=1 Tax=Rhizosphaericola mali TaxID=2545455 RepID=A0A5P2G3R0_9BACT|nr:hypothetical protein [Rhizosphaericola mali]QES88759.1 hypothetical protein E0W69_008880 [Rhizosphaericola mali]